MWRCCGQLTLGRCRFYFDRLMPSGSLAPAYHSCTLCANCGHHCAKVALLRKLWAPLCTGVTTAWTVDTIVHRWHYCVNWGHHCAQVVMHMWYRCHYCVNRLWEGNHCGKGHCVDWGYHCAQVAGTTAWTGYTIVHRWQPLVRGLGTPLCTGGRHYFVDWGHHCAQVAGTTAWTVDIIVQQYFI